MDGTLHIHVADGGARVAVFGGDWVRGGGPPSSVVVRELLQRAGAGPLAFDSVQVGRWDSSLLVAVLALEEATVAAGFAVARDGLPEGVRRLLELATAPGGRRGERRPAAAEPFVAGVGNRAVAFLQSWRDGIEFVGLLARSLGRLLVGKAQMRWADLWVVVQECGPEALPIVTLIALLMGVILAFVGTVQLAMFGAEIYVADLVAIGMIREMASIMTGVVMSGRTGAAFAARIGTMQVNEEIDALRTLGIDPTDFLALPRTLGLVVVMPLLCLYADLLGVLGGMLVGVGFMGIDATLYWNETKAVLSFAHLGVGLVQSVIFGVIVALFGCLRGMQCGRSASEVGRVTTAAVVDGIVGIVVATALVTWLCNLLHV